MFSFDDPIISITRAHVMGKLPLTGRTPWTQEESTKQASGALQISRGFSLQGWTTGFLQPPEGGRQPRY